MTKIKNLIALFINEQKEEFSIFTHGTYDFIGVQEDNDTANIQVMRPIGGDDTSSVLMETMVKQSELHYTYYLGKCATLREFNIKYNKENKEWSMNEVVSKMTPTGYKRETIWFKKAWQETV